MGTARGTGDLWSNDMNDDTPQNTTEIAGKLAWSFRFAMGRRLITVVIPPQLLLALALIALAGYALGSRHAEAEAQRQREMVALLQQRTNQLERSLEQTQSEREQLLELNEAQAQELSSELEEQAREMRRLWNQLGQPQGLASRRPLSSRSGQQVSRQALPPQSTARADSPALSQASQRYQALRVRSEEARQEVKELSQAARTLLDQRTPTLAPCRGEMSSGFGYRQHPVYGYPRLHSGCDFTTDHGTPIQATASGTVVRSEWYGGYGQTVEIEHSSELRTLYAHCDQLLVKKGQRVKKGQKIATVGTTGLSSGPHCHYEVLYKGKAVDPRRYLPRS